MIKTILLIGKIFIQGIAIYIIMMISLAVIILPFAIIINLLKGGY